MGRAGFPSKAPELGCKLLIFHTVQHKAKLRRPSGAQPIPKADHQCLSSASESIPISCLLDPPTSCRSSHSFFFFSILTYNEYLTLHNVVVLRLFNQNSVLEHVNRSCIFTIKTMPLRLAR